MPDPVMPRFGGSYTFEELEQIAVGNAAAGLPPNTPPPSVDDGSASGDAQPADQSQTDGDVASAAPATSSGGDGPAQTDGTAAASSTLSEPPPAPPAG